MKKKNKKKAHKEALKFLTTNALTLNKIRDLLGMQEYDDKDVALTFKRCIKEFLKNDTVDNEESFWRGKFKADDPEEEEGIFNPIQIDPDDKKKVKRVSQNNNIADLIDVLGGFK